MYGLPDIQKSMKQKRKIKYKFFKFKRKWPKGKVISRMKKNTLKQKNNFKKENSNQYLQQRFEIKLDSKLKCHTINTKERARKTQSTIA